MNNHKTNCSLKNNKSEQKRLKQVEWNKDRKSTNRVFSACKKCKGKIIWDKSIADYSQVMKKLSKQYTQHQKECESKPRSEWTIKVYASPSTGSDNYDPNNLPEGIYSEDNLLSISEKDSLGEIYQTNQDSNKNKFNWKHPLVIGGIVIGILAIVGLAIYFLTRNKSKNHES